MIAKIISVVKGAEYDGFIWNYYVGIETPGKTLLKVFDKDALNLSNLINKQVDLTLRSVFATDIISSELIALTGVLLNGVNDCTFWAKDDFEIFINKADISANLIPYDVISTLYFGRIDILRVQEVRSEA